MQAHREAKSLDVEEPSGLGCVCTGESTRPSPLSSRPERTRISYFALLATATCAALRRESRMQIPNTTGLNRKSGGAQWRDLRFSGPFLGMFFDRAKWRDLWFPFRVFTAPAKGCRSIESRRDGTACSPARQCRVCL
jgi:hypothetical protein